VARDPDPWDSTLPGIVGKRHASLQALKDAIETRALIFATVPEAEYVLIRLYRRSTQNALETVVFGYLRRQQGAFRHIHSLAMRAKLLGFRFRLEDEILHPLRTEDQI
jgi:hypothetical protein